MTIRFVVQTLTIFRRCLITCWPLQKRKLVVSQRRWTNLLTREPAMAKTDCTNEKMVWMMLVKISKMELARSENALTIEDMVMAGLSQNSGQWKEESCFVKSMRLAGPSQCSDLEM